ncbi:MAG: DMT family transporter [Actinobacteria bacterium]|nr:MAG: DMT family transporter [Actinomycetota bacterium]TMM26547.1 MAG: DMT family transporter [Actinomycetota bacterium]
MFAAALALAAAASWGVGDFFGGLKSRTLNPVAVLIVAQPIGLTLLAVWVAVRGQGPPGSAVLWACLAAVLGTTGLIAFYRGMAAGALSIVAPIAGAGAAIPVIWGLARGDHPSGYQELGFAAALIGVVLASFERKPEAARLAAGVGWAAIAMLAFGAYYIPMHAASHGDFLWAAFVFRLTSTTIIAAAWLALRPPGAKRTDLPVLASIGVLDTGGNVFFAAASAKGIVSVVSILASLYPVVTVLLARAVLHERVHRSQELGIALALAGIVLISAG